MHSLAVAALVIPGLCFPLFLEFFFFLLNILLTVAIGRFLHVILVLSSPFPPIPPFDIFSLPDLGLQIAAVFPLLITIAVQFLPVFGLQRSPWLPSLGASLPSPMQVF